MPRFPSVSVHRPRIARHAKTRRFIGLSAWNKSKQAAPISLLEQEQVLLQARIQERGEIVRNIEGKMMYYFIKDTRFDYGALYFDPKNDEYWGLGTVEAPVEGTKVTFKLTSPTTRKLNADYIQANRGFLCSRKMHDVLAAAGGEASFFPAVLHDRKNNAVNLEYFLLHISSKLDCFDFDRSDYEDRPAFEASGRSDLDAIKKVEKIVLDDGRVGGVRIFFASNAPFAYLPIVHESLAAKLVDAKLKGFELIRFDGFTWKAFGVR